MIALTDTSLLDSCKCTESFLPAPAWTRPSPFAPFFTASTRWWALTTHLNRGKASWGYIFLYFHALNSLPLSASCGLINHTGRLSLIFYLARRTSEGGSQPRPSLPSHKASSQGFQLIQALTKIFEFWSMPPKTPHLLGMMLQPTTYGRSTSSRTCQP